MDMDGWMDGRGNKNVDLDRKIPLVVAFFKNKQAFDFWIWAHTQTNLSIRKCFNKADE